MNSPVYKELGSVWSDVLKKDELPMPAHEALHQYAKETRTKILSKFHSAFAFGYCDDDYTHIVVVTTDGDAYLVEGAALRPTLIKKLT